MILHYHFMALRDLKRTFAWYVKQSLRQQPF